MVSLRDVAQAAGVSVATVSHVLNGTRYVSSELTERVRRALLDLNYQPNLVARSLRTQRSQTIGFITSDITNPFYPGVAQGASVFASQRGYSLMLCDVGQDGSGEEKIVFLLQQRQVDGLLFTSIHKDSSTVKALHEDKYPFVLINRQLNGIEANYVGIDNRDGMAQAVRHLVELGHRSVGFISGPTVSTAAYERLDGFLEAARSFGLDTDPQLICQGSYQIDDGYAAVRNFLSVRPDISAIVAANDLMAFGAWQCLHQLSVNVPRDISIIGFDDIPPASMGPTGLTTVHCSQYNMGERAARLLIEVLTSESFSPPRQIVLPVQLVVRNTTAARREYERISLSREAMSRVVDLAPQQLQPTVTMQQKEVSHV